jgi:pyrroloquinoline-quinone synthase
MLAAEEAMEASGVLHNPYFQRLQSDEMDRDAFLASQKQFFFAVRFFPRPMNILLARLPEPADRLLILENVVEEHGHMNASGFHVTTFTQFLMSLGAKGSVDPPGPEVTAFNHILTTACAHDIFEKGVACMGVIERAFADISTIIGQAVVSRGWIREEELVHYKLHAAIDRQHAEDFFSTIALGWNDRERQKHIRDGLVLGLYAFNRLYADMNAMTLR